VGKPWSLPSPPIPTYNQTFFSWGHQGLQSFGPTLRGGSTISTSSEKVNPALKKRKLEMSCSPPQPEAAIKIPTSQ